MPPKGARNKFFYPKKVNQKNIVLHHTSAAQLQKSIDQHYSTKTSKKDKESKTQIRIKKQADQHSNQQNCQQESDLIKKWSKQKNENKLSTFVFEPVQSKLQFKRKLSFQQKRQYTTYQGFNGRGIFYMSEEINLMENQTLPIVEIQQSILHHMHQEEETQTEKYQIPINQINQRNLFKNDQKNEQRLKMIQEQNQKQNEQENQSVRSLCNTSEYIDFQQSQTTGRSKQLENKLVENINSEDTTQFQICFIKVKDSSNSSSYDKSSNQKNYSNSNDDKGKQENEINDRKIQKKIKQKFRSFHSNPTQEKQQIVKQKSQDKQVDKQDSDQTQMLQYREQDQIQERQQNNCNYRQTKTMQLKTIKQLSKQSSGENQSQALETKKQTQME